MTRGSNRKSLPSWKKVAKFFDTKALLSQLYMTMMSLLTCTIQEALVATSPSGGKTLPPVVCASLVLATCMYSDTPVAGGGAAPPPLAADGARAAAAFLAAM